MQASRLRARLRVLALLFLLLPAALPLTVSRTASAQSVTPTGEQSLSTKYFTIYYPAGEDETARWYAGFADDVNLAVAEMLGQDPLNGLTLRIYATEADYIAANPAAETHAGIMAHSIPDQLEVGVAVERLRQVDPEIARESFRHEMTHIVAGALSNQRLTIAFQEGLAQYNELSTRRAQESMLALKAAADQGVPYLSWFMLNERSAFMTSPDLSYPESYSMMAFLAEKYGMGTFARFMSGLRNGMTWTRSLRAAYGKNLGGLEAEWRDWLPSFLKDGWQTNLLQAYDLSAGVALYEAGHFAEARDRFAASEQLYRDLGRDERAQTAADYKARAEKAGEADAQATEARKSLESYDYAAAHSTASTAYETFSSLNLAAQSEVVSQTVALSARGLDAVSVLQRAQDALERFDVPTARANARQAAQTFADLGDTARAQQATDIVSGLSAAITTLGWGAFGAGALALAVASFAAVRKRRRLRPAQAVAAADREESASWL